MDGNKKTATLPVLLGQYFSFLFIAKMLLNITDNEPQYFYVDILRDRVPIFCGVCEQGKTVAGLQSESGSQSERTYYGAPCPVDIKHCTHLI